MIEWLITDNNWLVVLLFIVMALTATYLVLIGYGVIDITQPIFRRGKGGGANDNRDSL